MIMRLPPSRPPKSPSEFCLPATHSNMWGAISLPLLGQAPGHTVAGWLGSVGSWGSPEGICLFSGQCPSACPLADGGGQKGGSRGRAEGQGRKQGGASPLSP